MFNVSLDNAFSVEQLMNATNDIFNRQDLAFRLSLELGLNLVQSKTGAYRYFNLFF